MGTRSEDVFLTEDLSVQCWSSTHFGFIGTLGVPLLLLYVLGIPSVVYRILSRPANKTKVETIIRTLSPPAETDHKPDQTSPPQRHHTLHKSLMGQMSQRELASLASLAKNRAVSAAAAVSHFDKATLSFHSNFSFLFLGFRQQAYPTHTPSHRCALCSVVLCMLKAIVSWLVLLLV